MTCIGNRVNATSIPDNFDHISIAVEIATLPPIFIEIIWIRLGHTPGLFVAPAEMGFFVAVNHLNGLEICSISVQQNSAGAWYIACNNPSVIYNQNAYNMVLCSWIHWLCICDKVIQLKCFILELERERVVGERLSWLIWATFDLEHEAWLVSHEAYFNLAKTRWSTRFLLRLYEHISSPLIILGVHCLQCCVNIPGSFENFPGIATVWICNEYITFFVILWFMPWGNWVPKILILWYSLLSIRD